MEVETPKFIARENGRGGEMFVSKGNETAREVEAIGSENNALALKIVFSTTGLAKNFPRVIG